MSDSLRIKDISQWLESIAPLLYQESYDNSGLLVGTPETPVDKILVSLDCTEAVVDEAIEKGCQLIVAHHPIIFGGLKKLNGKNYVERTVIKAIKNDIAIYAIHTNLDNVNQGVNRKIGEQLGLKNLQILAPKTDILRKLVTYVPLAQLEEVKNALFGTGAGTIGEYDQCSFSVEGTGTFRAGENANPFVGKKGEQHRENEYRLEVIFPTPIQDRIVKALLDAHPYEEVAYDIIPLANTHQQVGAGMIGELENGHSEADFLARLKQSMNLQSIRYTALPGKTIKKVAVCGGAGSFLLKTARTAGADAFVTADFKYHEFFDAENRIMIADIGHYESEIFTKDLLKELIRKKFPTFAVLLSEINTNPINYF